MDSEHVFERLVAQSLESRCILLNVGLYGSLNTFCHGTADFEIYTYIITQIAKCISGLSFYVCSHRLMHTHKKINTHCLRLCAISKHGSVTDRKQTDGQTQEYANETKRVRRL